MVRQERLQRTGADPHQVIVRSGTLHQREHDRPGHVGLLLGDALEPSVRPARPPGRAADPARDEVIDGQEQRVGHVREGTGEPRLAVVDALHPRHVAERLVHHQADKPLGRDRSLEVLLGLERILVQPLRHVILERPLVTDSIEPRRA